jgi:hypothetical protein
MLPFNPLMGYVAAGTLVIGAVAGYKVRDWQCDAAYSKALEKAEKQRAEMQKAVDDVSQTYEAERDQANVVATERTNTIREIYKTAPAVPADCTPPDGISGLLESGVRDANAAASGKSGVELPTASQSSGTAD